MAADLVDRARGGDEEALRQLAAPYRRELHVHCYRILGSPQEAEDALQEALLAVWQGLRGFEGRASVRTWLYRVTGQAISLAFMTALQLLPPRQRAVLILRDVLGFTSSEAGHILGCTGDLVTSALKRARAAVQHRLPPLAGQPPGGFRCRAGDRRPAQRAYDAGDVAGLIALLSEDVRLTMPPVPLEVPGTGAGNPLPRRCRFPPGPHVPAAADPRQRPAGIRRICPRPAGRRRPRE